MKKISLLYIFIFLFSIISVSALPTNYLEGWWNFDDGNVTHVNDQINNYDFTATSTGRSSVTGIIGLAQNLSGSLGQGALSTTIYNIGSSSYSYNYWYSTSAPTNSQLYSGVYNSSSVGHSLTRFVPNNWHYRNQTSGTPFTVSDLSNGQWHMMTITHDQSTNIVKMYLDGNLTYNGTVNDLPPNVNTFSFGAPMYYTSLDEVTLWSTILSQADVTELYNSGNGLNMTTQLLEKTPVDIGLALVNTNQRVVDGVSYVFPIVEESTIITGLFNVITNTPTPYDTTTCDYSETTIFNDTINYDNITANGWSDYGIYRTQQFTSRLGLSMWLNGSNSATTLTKLFNPTSNDTIVSYIVKPQYTGTFGDLSGQLLISVQSSIGQDIVPLNYVFDDTANTLCVYGYLPSPTLILCAPYSNGASDYATVTLDVMVSSSVYDLTLDVGGTKYYSVQLDTYTYGADNIGKFYINPLSTDSISYVDNFVVKIIPPLNDMTLRPVEYQNLTGDYVYGKSCDYSTVKCYNTRFYVTDSNEFTYNVHEDYYVCSTLNTAITSSTATDTTAQTSSFLYGNGLTTAFRMLVVFITILVIMGGSAVIGFQTDTSKASMVVGVTLSVFALIFFTVFGWIPSWILVMLVVFALATMIIIGKQNNVATG